MAEDSPLPERILDATEAVLRRHGAAKANVVDVARALGMSHANIYRHFAHKKALLDAVAARWLHAVSAPLETIAADAARPAGERLAAWFDALRAAKQGKFRDDPELFRVYHAIAGSAREVVGAHVAALLGQLERIVADGVRAGEFRAGLEPAGAARAFLQATAPFHHPAMVVQEPAPTGADARAVLDLLLAGLRADPPPAAGTVGRPTRLRRPSRRPR